jgi:hypothetical protein
VACPRRRTEGLGGGLNRPLNLDAGVFTSGPYIGDSLADVADEDPDYIRGILAKDRGTLDPEHAEALREAIGESS